MTNITFQRNGTIIHHLKIIFRHSVLKNVVPDIVFIILPFAEMPNRSGILHYKQDFIKIEHFSPDKVNKFFIVL